ncbi:MAG: 3-mercaptopyruvate sulfurtransferase [Hyphomicrobiaceae bacterium]
MTSLRNRHLVDTNWLADRLEAPDLIVVDGSLHLPTAGRNARDEYDQAHIPGALFFDIEAISDHSNPLPHMLPSSVQFASSMKKMGIGDGTRVVVYDTVGLYSAARVWWMLRIMGHQDVAVLDGGLKKWRAEGRPVTDEPTPPRQPAHFTPRFNGGLVRDLDDMKLAITKGLEQVLDARSPGRFKGQEKEPRPGLRPGHMPGAINVPYGTLIREDGTLKSEPELRAAFHAAGVDLSRPTVTSCGSGVTAGILTLALAILGRGDVAVYDGSWVEWGHEAAGTDVVTG